MSENRLLSRLKKKDKKGLFKSSNSDISYATGFLPLDYRNGYMMESTNMDNVVTGTYPSLGIVGGSMVTIVGKSATAKTTFAMQMAASIIKPFPDGIVMHFDLERATNYNRVKAVTGLKQSDMEQRYILKKDQGYIEDIMEAIMDIAHMKESYKEDFMYDTGLKDEFDRPLKVYVPTVVIIDSIPSLCSTPDTITDKETKTKLEKLEVGGSMSRNRDVQKISDMYMKLMGPLKQYNITVITINHIKQKLDINPFAKSQAQVMWLKQDESLPGGNASIYYANNIFKFVSVGGGKKTVEDDGFDGFTIRCELIKSRTNKAGQSCTLIYNQSRGFDPILSLFEFAKEHGLMAGSRKNARYFVGHEDIKFNEKDFVNEFIERQEVRYALHDVTLPILNSQLSVVDTETVSKMQQSIGEMVMSGEMEKPVDNIPAE